MEKKRQQDGKRGPFPVVTLGPPLWEDQVTEDSKILAYHNRDARVS